MDYKILEGPESIQGSPEWLKWRRTRVMASDAPIIMGESLYKKTEQLCYEKQNGIETRCNYSMQRGKDLEPVALAWFNKEIGGEPFKPVVVESLIYDGLGASLDGFRVVDGITEALEIKVPGEKNHLTAMSGSVPIQWHGQIEHIMLVLGIPRMYYMSFDGERGIILKVAAIKSYQKELLVKEQAFLALLRNQSPTAVVGEGKAKIIDFKGTETIKS